MALLNAPIVHVRRDPIDTCLSCYSKLFAYGWHQTYDLGELGRFYRAYEDLMRHWRAVLPAGTILDVTYEEVVSDTESAARRILAHCGLPWDPCVLDFHTNQRAVRTASAAQVRRPIYSSSLARRRHYEKHLGQLVRELGG